MIESLCVRIRDTEGKAGIVVPIIHCSAKILVEDGLLTNRHKEKAKTINAFKNLSQGTMSMEAVTFLPWIMNL